MSNNPAESADKTRSDGIALVKHASFKDIDRMGETLKGWEVSCTQLTRGPFQGMLTFLEQRDLQIYQLRTQQAVQVMGAKPTSRWLFAFPLVSFPQAAYSCDTSLTTDCIFGFDAHREVNHISDPHGVNLGCIGVSKSLFENYVAQAGRDDLDEAFMKRNVVVPEGTRFAPLVCYLRQLFWHSQQQPELVNAYLDAKLIEQDLLPLLINALKPRESEDSLRLYPRADIVKVAREFMAMNLQRPLTLADICQAVHASKRSLHYGFQDMFGMGPMAFLKVLRLHEIRRILLSAEPKSLQVKEVASTWGFYSMGHFSRDYKQLFGESPSQTLNR
ncbi:helix-turn-helix domain-containing protein [Leptolyngbya iicbica]|uniref:Helix-turn-helix domain-containing protein n=2 Tax=Cyanophyceae TaxID=3028117 RepID=A0A4Q7E423_9CYAN|nr:helix-turn-helix domain-containing protein [Leptolyngbya sp. LK]RZM76661.1 helix-turn-helix domain-containing protein [Leptolyngbya sp. LK]